ncbi:PREDICTED: beta-2-microglobulin-like, partial [Gekko japonicus]|uniref:Beta-2-microglobulin-like n=1 Tax=Gekko japonicus TaxID=146911 RepID=A0ABM1K4P8_GEKJA
WFHFVNGEGSRSVDGLGGGVGLHHSGGSHKSSTYNAGVYPLSSRDLQCLQCYADRFHPPKISIELLRISKPMESQKSDLSFHQDWAFHLLVYAHITIDGKTEYACKVEHETFRELQTHKLEWEF